MGREVRARIEQLREKMAERGMDAYLIPTSDFHGSEYVSGYFKCRKYMTGFTGSAGTAVITICLLYTSCIRVQWRRSKWMERS